MHKYTCTSTHAQVCEKKKDARLVSARLVSAHNLTQAQPSKMPYYTDFYGKWSVPIYIDEMPQQPTYEMPPQPKYAIYWTEHTPPQPIQCAVYWFENDETASHAASHAASHVPTHSVKTAHKNEPTIRRKSPLQNGPVPSQYNPSSSSSGCRIYMRKKM
jgi:hypothetical protein